MADLLICRGTAIERRVPLAAGGTLLVGRNSDNDIELPDPSKAVSRTHAELHCEGGQFVLVDRGSENGLWRNGERLARVALSPVDAVVIGPYRLLLDVAEDEPQTVFRPLPAGADEKQPAAPVAAATAPPRKRTGLALLPASARSRTAILGATAVLVVVLVAGIVWPRGYRGGDKSAGAAQHTAQPGDAPAAQPAAPAGSAAGQHVARAQQLIDGGDYSGASAELTLALKAEPGHAQAIALTNVVNERVRARSPSVPPVPPPANAPSPAPGATVAPPRSETTKPTPAEPVPDFAVAQRTGERPRDYRDRVKQLYDRYTSAIELLDRGDATAAIAALQALLAEEPGQPEAEAALNRARQLRQQAAKQQAQDAVATATKLETEGHLRAAAAQYEKARQMEGAPAGIDDALARVQKRRIADGLAALKDAKQFHTFRKMREAIDAYERAVELLPETHPDHAAAQAGLRAARGGGDR